MTILWFVVLTVTSLQVGLISCENDLTAEIDLIDIINRMNAFEKREMERVIEQKVLKTQVKEMQVKIETLETENDLLKRDIAQLKDIVNNYEKETESYGNDFTVSQTDNDTEFDKIVDSDNLEHGETNPAVKVERSVGEMLGSHKKSTSRIIKKSLVDDIRDQRRGLNDVRQVNGADTELGVAFYAALTHHLTHVGVNQTIVFDKVYTNIGNAYSTHAGDFRAPVSGIYVFSTTLMAFNTHRTQYHIVKNGSQVGNIYLHGSSSPYITDSLTIVLYLNIGDEVAIINLYADENLDGLEYSTFSGFLLQRDFTPTNVVG